MAFTSVRRNLSREIAELCVLICIIDAVSGILSPTFSLFAENLGVSLALLGIIITVGGLTQLIIALPFGVLSDRIGRPTMLVGGVVAFTLCLFTAAFAAGPILLFTSRVLYGIGGVATFSIGAGYLGDITTREQRPFAFGLYTSAMGFGFAVGPFVGARLVERYDARTAYIVGGLLALAGLLLALRILRAANRRKDAPVMRRASGMGNVRGILGQHDLMLVTFGNMLMSIAFAGGVTTFFPIYADELLISQAAIGSMFALRALVSTLGRVPNGMISRTLGSQPVMLSALLVDTLVMFSIGHTANPTLLTLLLAIEGLAFGAYLVSGQTYVADHTSFENRGAAVGVYSTASSLGSTIAPLALGLVASAYSVRLVFTVTGAALAIGLILSVVGYLVLARTHAQPLAPKSADS
ncbi:MAG TPA: MFS transporter [Nitrolancea sp.]